MGNFSFRCNNMTKEQKFPSISPSIEPHLVQCWQCLSVLRLSRGHNWQSLLCCQFAKWFHIHQEGLVNGCLLGILKNGCEVSVRSFVSVSVGYLGKVSMWSLYESVEDLCVLSVDEASLWGFYVRSLSVGFHERFVWKVPLGSLWKICCQVSGKALKSVLAFSLRICGATWGSYVRSQCKVSVGQCGR